MNTPPQPLTPSKSVQKPLFLKWNDKMPAAEKMAECTNQIVGLSALFMQGERKFQFKRAGDEVPSEHPREARDGAAA